MVRYTRRRTRSVRRRTRKRGVFRTRRTRTRTRTRRMKGRRVTQGTVFTFQRQTEVALFNQDPGTGVPDIFSSDYQYLSVGPPDTTTQGIIAPTACSNYGFSITDALSKLQNWSEFSTLFQYYRIKRITRKFVPVFGPGTTNSTGAVSGSATSTFAYPTPTLMVLPDKDSNEPVTAALARETMGVRRVLMNKPFVDSWSPVPNMVVGNGPTGGSVFAVIPKRSPWLSIDEAPNTVHFGRRYGVIDWPGPNNDVGAEGDCPNCMWRIYSTYTVEFKGIR